MAAGPAANGSGARPALLDVRLDIEGASEWWQLRRIQRLLSAQPGVTRVRIDLTECQALVELDPELASVASLRRAVAPLGCELTPLPTPSPPTPSLRSDDVVWRLLSAPSGTARSPAPTDGDPRDDAATTATDATADAHVAGKVPRRRRARWLAPAAVTLASALALATGATVANSIGPLELTSYLTGGRGTSEVSVDEPPASLPGNGDAPLSGDPALDPPPVPAAALPASLEIPALEVRSSPLVDLGVNPDGTLEVPADYDRVGWFARGPAPGGPGPAVLVGHVDSKTGPAVFFRLEDLRTGDEVFVTRRDGQRLRFTVERTERHAKTDFPTREVYGPTPGASLRLITCGGRFDPHRESYEDNVIVFANLDRPPLTAS